jgi:hypothetical protein
MLLSSWESCEGGCNSDGDGDGDGDGDDGCSGDESMGGTLLRQLFEPLGDDGFRVQQVLAARRMELSHAIWRLSLARTFDQDSAVSAAVRFSI